MYTSQYDPQDSPSSEQAKAIGEQAAKQVVAVIGTTALAGIASIVTGALTSLLVTNYHKQSLTGDKTLTPTDDTTTLDKKETAAAEQNSKLADEEFKAQESSLAGVDTDANGAATATDATRAKVAAAQTDAGTIETSATAMQIN